MLVNSMIFVFMQRLLILSFCRSTFITSVQDCQDACPMTDEFRGFVIYPSIMCICLYDAGSLPPASQDFTQVPSEGSGPITSTFGSGAGTCYKYNPAQ